MRSNISYLAGLALLITPALAPAHAAPAFALEDYFLGKTVAKGLFVSKVGGSRREFDVFLTGKWDGKTLRLQEDFVYKDGEKDRKTWVFTKLSEGQYSGTREDVIGKTLVTITGNVARFRYNVMIPRKGKKPIKVHFNDKMILKENGVVENRAKVSKFGLPVGKVAVNFTRGRHLDKTPEPKL